MILFINYLLWRDNNNIIIVKARHSSYQAIEDFLNMNQDQDHFKINPGSKAHRLVESNKSHRF